MGIIGRPARFIMTLALAIMVLQITQGLAFAQGTNAQDITESEFRFVSDLASDGFEPFAASSTGKASFGMKRGNQIYLCFLADTPILSRNRSQVLTQALRDEEATRILPNIPVVCIRAE